MSTTDRETALITGASGGFGFEFAKIFARAGYNLVLVARNAAKLEALAEKLRTRHGVAVRVLPQDLAVPGAAAGIFSTLQGEGIDVHVLVNNAGFATYGPFAEIALPREQEELQVNVVALTELTKLFLPAMLARGAGKILNVASTAAFQPGPLMAVYYASKAYVLFLSEAVAEEVRGSGVTVTALCPGPAQTGFQQRARMQESRLIKGRQIMDARTIALAGYQGLMAGKTVVIPGLRNRLLALSPRVAPRAMVAAAVRRMQDPAGR